MPVQTTSPYPTAEQVLEAARVMANDMQISIDGDILSDAQPYIFPMINLCYEKLQRRLIRSGVNTYNKYLIITNLVPVASTDPTTQVQLMYTGYYDGNVIHANPTLPEDLIIPLEIWERQSLTNNRWCCMGRVADSTTTSWQTGGSRGGEWERDTS